MDTTDLRSLASGADEGYNDDEMEGSAAPLQLAGNPPWFQQFSPTQRQEMAYELLSSLPRSYMANVHRQVTRLLKVDIIGLLPTEIALKILSYLPVSALLTATLINNRWHCVANDQSLWKSLCRERGWEWKYERREVSQPQRSSSPRKDREVDEGVGEDEDEGNGAGFDAGLAPTNSSVYNTHLAPSRASSSSANPHLTRVRHSSPCILPSPSPSSLPNYKLLFQTRTLLQTRLCNGSFRRTTLLSSPSADRTATSGGFSGSSVSTPDGHTATIYSVCLITHPATGAPTLFTASRDTTVLQWDLSFLSLPHMSQSLPYSAWAPRPTHAFTGGHTGSVLSICIVKSERWLVSGGSDGRIVIWDLETGCVVKTLKGKEGHTDSVLCVACDEKRIVSCSKDKTIRTFFIPSLKPHLVLKSHRAAVNAVALSGTHIASASGDRSLRLWDAETGKVLRVFEAHHTRGLASIAFLPPYVVTGSSDKHVRLFDLSTDRGWSTDPNPVFPPPLPSLANLSLTNPLVPAAAAINSSRLSGVAGGGGYLPAPSTLAALSASAPSSEGEVCEVCGGGGRRRTIRNAGHTGLVRAVAMNEDIVVSGSYDERVKVWDRKTGSLIVDLKGGHDGRIFSVAFDCTKIVSCGEDQKICIWDLGWGIDTSFVKL